MPCTCTPDTLSQECADTAACLTGVAKSRADRYAREAPGWPTSAEIRAAAAEWVADLGSCDRMRVELAVRTVRAAALSTRRSRHAQDGVIT